MQVFYQYADILSWIDDKGYDKKILGHAPDGAPIVCLKTGGDKTPAVFISAGSHSTEQAGVSAALALVEQLQTEHQVYILPNRDPMGMNGFAYVLAMALGTAPRLESIDDLPALLRSEGEVLWEEGDKVLALIGEYGYSTHNLYGRIDKGAALLEPLKGRRIFFPSRDQGIEGTAPLERAYTLIVTPEGEVLHINRFHDTPWAPAECRCTRQLMAKVQPRLTLDLHEYGGEAFWFSARHQPDPENETWEKRIADGILTAVEKSGAPMVAKEYMHKAFFEKDAEGVLWLIAQDRGEGLNLADFSAAHYGPAFTIETGMQNSFAHRVSTAVLAAQTAVEVFARRYP